MNTMQIATRRLFRPSSRLHSFSLFRALAAKASATRRANKSSGVKGEEERKDRILDEVITELNKDYGQGHMMKLGQDQVSKLELTPSGCLTLDLALGGGYPVGRIVEIFGPESAGKTSIALHAMSEVQKAGGKVVMVDAENCFNTEFAKKLGLRVDEMYLCQPSCGEEALETVDKMTRTGSISMICIDSVSALVPKAEIQGEIGASQVGTQARMMSAALRRLVESAGKYRCTIVFINQIRHKIGILYGNPETTSGGNALKFYASVRLEVRRKEFLGPDKENPDGIKIKCKVVKNKVAPPSRVAEVNLMFDSGIDELGGMLDGAEKCGVIQLRGSWYYKGETKLAQGREKALEYLRSDSEMQEAIKAEMFAPREDSTEAGKAVDPETAAAGIAEDLDQDEIT